MFCMSGSRGGRYVSRAMYGARAIRVRTDEEHFLLGFDETFHGVRPYLFLAAAWGPVQFEHGPAFEAAAEESVERRTRGGVAFGCAHHRGRGLGHGKRAGGASG